MAKGSAKRINAGNIQALSFFLKGNMITSFMHLLVSVYFNEYQSFQWIFLYTTSTGLLFFFHYLLQKHSTASISEEGIIEDPRIDLNDQSNYFVQYISDYIYLTWFVLIGSLIWSKLWWAYILIPLYATYKLVQIVKPFMGSSNGVAIESMKPVSKPSPTLSSKKAVSKRRD